MENTPQSAEIRASGEKKLARLNGLRNNTYEYF